MHFSQQQIRSLESQVLELQTDLGASNSEIANLKLRIEEAARAYSRQRSELTSTTLTVEARDVVIARLRCSMAKAMEKVNKPPRHLVHASTQSVPSYSILVDSATQTIEPVRTLVDFSVQVQEPPRQVTEMAVQATEPARVFANSSTQADDPPPTVSAVEYEKVLIELEELRRRFQDAESKRAEIDVEQAEEAVSTKQEAHEQDDAFIQLPNGGPTVSIQTFAAFLGAKLNQAFAPQVVDSMPQPEEEVVDAEEILLDSPTNESSLALVTDISPPIPNVSPDMPAAYEAIAGKKFTLPVHPDLDTLDKMPLRQWIMAALQKLYIDRVGKYGEIVESQASEQVQGLNTAATQALGQGGHALIIAMWQLDRAHTLSKMSPEEVVQGSLAPAYVVPAYVDWKWGKPMDDDRIGQSFYKVCGVHFT
jgi:hypothetical protein